MAPADCAWNLPKPDFPTCPCTKIPSEPGPSGYGAAWLARLSGGQKVAGSNPASPTNPIEVLEDR